MCYAQLGVNVLKPAQHSNQIQEIAQMACFCYVQVEMTLLEAAQESKQAQLDLFQSEKERLEADMDVPLKLKQGQVEIELQGIVDGNLDLALLIPESLIQVFLSGNMLLQLGSGFSMT